MKKTVVFSFAAKRETVEFTLNEKSFGTEVDNTSCMLPYPVSQYMTVGFVSQDIRSNVLK